MQISLQMLFGRPDVLLQLLWVCPINTFCWMLQLFVCFFFCVRSCRVNVLAAKMGVVMGFVNYFTPTH
jgi:hypothetical protein